jgi:ribokinase
MIVVVGNPAWHAAEPAAPAGRTCGIALAAARAGARVELVGRVGDDAAGDALLIALARAGVGHVAMLRDPARATPIVEPAAPEEEAPSADPAPAGTAIDPDTAPRLEAADVALALGYLPAIDVLVVSDDVPPDVLPACLEGARFAGARPVLALRPGEDAPVDLPPDAIVLIAPEEDGDAFAALLGRFAAALDAGGEPEAAFRAATADGWEPVLRAG